MQEVLVKIKERTRTKGKGRKERTRDPRRQKAPSRNPKESVSTAMAKGTEEKLSQVSRGAEKEKGTR